MIRLLPSLTLTVPFVFCSLILMWTYDLTSEFLILPHLFVSFIFVIIFDLLIDRFANLKTRISSLKIASLRGSSSNLILIIFSWAVISIGILDLFYHGLVILNPTTYDDFTPFQAWIRYFSSLSWILAPLALFLDLNKKQRCLLLMWSFVFPVLVVDRNRLFMAAFAFVFSFFFLDLKDKLQKRSVLIISCFAVISSIVIFAKMGDLKNSALTTTYQASSVVPKNNFCEKAPRYLPVKEEFKKLPDSFQWIFLYSITPIYNLSIQYICSVQDSSVLKAQLIPFWKRYNQVGTPYLVASSMNVGTEIMPFFLAFGVASIYFCFFIAFFINRLFFMRYGYSKSIFDLLIFMRLSYCSLMFGFAPQYFIYTNLGFIIVMLILKKISESDIVVSNIKVLNRLINQVD